MLRNVAERERLQEGVAEQTAIAAKASGVTPREQDGTCRVSNRRAQQCGRSPASGQRGNARRLDTAWLSFGRVWTEGQTNLKPGDDATRFGGLDGRHATGSVRGSAARRRFRFRLAYPDSMRVQTTETASAAPTTLSCSYPLRAGVPKNAYTSPPSCRNVQFS